MPMKKLLGNFFEFDESPKKKEEPKKEAADEASTLASVSAQVSQPPKQVAYGSVDPQMLEMLDGAIADANQPGFDYFEFAQALSNLGSLPEHQRFQAVFTTAKSMGVTQKGLVESVEHYQRVLEQEQKSFLQHVESKRAQEIVSRQEMKVANEKTIAAAQTQIAELQQKISELQHANINLDTEISQETLQINNTSSAFEATYNTVFRRLEDDKAKIQSHLSDGV